MRDEIYDLGLPTATSPQSPDPNEFAAKAFIAMIATALVLYGAVIVTIGGFH